MAWVALFISLFALAIVIIEMFVRSDTDEELKQQMNEQVTISKEQYDELVTKVAVNSADTSKVQLLVVDLRTQLTKALAGNTPVTVTDIRGILNQIDSAIGIDESLLPIVSTTTTNPTETTPGSNPSGETSSPTLPDAA